MLKNRELAFGMICNSMCHVPTASMGLFVFKQPGAGILNPRLLEVESSLSCPGSHGEPWAEEARSKANQACESQLAGLQLPKPNFSVPVIL
jgi:hypothetical protein